MLRQAATSGRPIGGRTIIAFETLEKVQCRVEAEAEEPPAKSRKIAGSVIMAEATVLSPLETTPKAASIGVKDMVIGDDVTLDASDHNDSEVVAAMRRQAEEKRRRVEEEERQVSIIKEQRLQEIFEDMDTQMRGWCQRLLARKCVGELWRSIGKNKLKILSEPSLDSDTFEGEYIPPNMTFGVVESRVADAALGLVPFANKEQNDFPAPGAGTGPNVLVRCGRLMAPEEVPEGFRIAEDDSDSE